MGTQNEVFDAEVMGEQLKKLRKKVKLSQEKFAERMGMSKDTIYNYEKGKTAIPHDLIKRLCQEFNVSADYFYFETDKPLVEDNTISMPDYPLSRRQTRKEIQLTHRLHILESL